MIFAIPSAPAPAKQARVRHAGYFVGGLLSLLTLLWVAAPALAEDWPAWRHDHNRSGVSSEKLTFPLEEAWVFKSRQSAVAPNPAPHHYPAISQYTMPITAAGDSVFFTSAIDGRIGCLDAATGAMRWEYMAGCAVHRAPTIWNGKVYAGSSDGYVYCLNAKTGELVWKFRAAPEERWILAYAKPVSCWPVRTDVTIAADPKILGGKPVAYFAAGVFPHDGTFLYAVDAETGEQLWQNATQAESGWRASMAPAGYLFLNPMQVVVPRDFLGYFDGWGTLITFDRTTGNSGYYTSGPPLVGVRKDDVHFNGNAATQTVPGAEGKPPTNKQLWREETPGRNTDIDSIVSIRYKRPVFFRWDPDLATIAYAGGTVYNVALGKGSGVYARDANTGKLLFSSDMAEDANQVIVANGRLFTATRQGTIYCYAPQGGKKLGVIQEPVETTPFAGDAKLAAAAESMLGQSGVKAGYAVVLDSESGALAYELAKRSNLYVLAVFRDADKMAAARKAYNRAGLHVSRIVAYHQEEGKPLPFTSYIADLIVSEGAVSGGQLPTTDQAEINRLLKPIRGVALVGGKQAEEALTKWSGAEKGWKVETKGEDRWAQRTRPALENPGGWTHAYGDAGNTGSSHDGALKGPLGIYWYGEPQLGHPAPGALMIDGVFLLVENGVLVARDQYTGREMWRREQGQTDTVCGPGSVLMRYMEVIVRLDPATGKEIQAYKPPVPNALWHAMSADPDGKTMYLVMGGKDAQQKDFRTTMAVDVASGNVLWKLDGVGGWSAIGDGLMYFFGGAAEGPHRDQAISEMRAYLTANDQERLHDFEATVKDRDIRMLKALDTKTGKILYEHGVDITNCGGKFLPGVGYGGGKNFRHYNPRVESWVMARKDVIVFGTQSGADKGWSVWPGGAYKQRSLAVHDGKTGKLIWNKPCNYRTRPVISDETIYAEPWGYDMRTGNRKQRVHPITGEQTDWAFCRNDKQCGTFTASLNFIFGRSLGVGYHDVGNDNGLYTFFHSRMSCDFDAFSGGGMMVKPPNAVSCKCSWSLPFTIALGEVSKPPATPQAYPQPGPNLPVKHLYLDMGGNGARRDKNNQLWMPPLPNGHFLLMGTGVTMAMYEGGAGVQRSSLYTPIENTDVPFVFASALRGMKQCVIPVTKLGEAPQNYTVRLGFAALPGDVVGQRVFDVKLDGEVVLKDFDIVKEAGKTDRAVWKEFTRTAKENLTLELVAKNEKPTAEQMPLINGIVVLRK